MAQRCRIKKQSKKMSAIRVPDFDPRDYQLPFLQAMDNGCTRAVLVWHRRAGKEVTCWNFMIRQAFWHRIGTYCYFFPTSRLGRRILWDGCDKDGRRFIHRIPKDILDGEPNSVEMKIRFKNGSIIQIVGTDQVTNVGINPVGCVYSEYSLQSPEAWTYTRPILRENGGWAVFNYTPRGRNHAYDLFTMAENNPDWFCQKLAISDTGVLTEEDIAKEREEGMSEDMIQQEYYCNFSQGVEGAYYAKYVEQASLDGRLGNVPYDPYAMVDTYWDLGVSDSTAIIFAQNVGNEIHIIDTYEATGEGLSHYAKVLAEKARENFWEYRSHYAPHDIKVRELGHGARTRLEMARELGIRFEIVPNMPVHEGIEMARGLWPRLWIDQNHAKRFIKCAENYHKHYNEKFNVYSDKPVHDWSSHMMDAFRYMAIAQNREKREKMTERDALALEKAYAIRH